MDVDVDSLAQARQDLEEEEVDVASGFRDVGRVDEQDVIGVQLLECRKWHVLYQLVPQRYLLEVARPQ